MVVVQHVLLGLSLAGLAGAGLRLAALTGATGMARALAAVTLAASAACLSALLLGLAGLGTSAIALPLAAAALWIAARLWLPEPAPPPRRELVRAWTATPLAGRLLLGALAGAWLAWTAWLLRYPALGIDSVLYHLPQVVMWVQGGSPGAADPVFPSLPVENYPVTNEVILAWGMGISRSFVWTSVWTPVTLALLAGAGWSGLRALRVARLPAGLAVAAIALAPVLSHYQQNGAYTDLPALAWLVTAAALAAHTRRHPALLVPALLAAALAVGTKTTTLPLAFTAVALATYQARTQLRPLTRPLALAATAAIAVGGYWYLRNLVDHGSPFWPFLSTPWGDPVPEPGANTRFVERPWDTLDALGDEYLQLLAGGLVLLGGALLSPLLARTRAVAAGAAATAVSVLLWLVAPYTGLASSPTVTLSTIRYLLPAFAVAALTLALASRDARRAAVAPTVALAGAAALGAVQTLDLGFPYVPGAGTLVAGVACGALAALVATLAAPRLADLPRPAAAVTATLAGALLGVLAAPGYVERHADTVARSGPPKAGGPQPLAGEALDWLLTQPRFRSGDAAIGMTPAMIGLLAGDRLQHDISLVPARERCPAVLDRTRRGYVLVFRILEAAPELVTTPGCLAGSRAAFRSDHYLVYGG